MNRADRSLVFVLGASLLVAVTILASLLWPEAPARRAQELERKEDAPTARAAAAPAFAVEQPPAPEVSLETPLEQALTRLLTDETAELRGEWGAAEQDRFHRRLLTLGREERALLQQRVYARIAAGSLKEIPTETFEPEERAPLTTSATEE